MKTTILRNGLKGLPLALCFCAGVLPASDHGDPNSVADNPVANLLDLYAFVDPFCQAQGGVGCEEGPDELILALTLYPDATADSRFSSDVQYHFYIENDNGQDLQVDCSVSDEQVVSCSSGGLAAQAPVGQVGVNGGMRVFAGLRDDPFFVDGGALQDFAQIGVAAFSEPGVDTLAGQNVLAIVVGIDVDGFPAGAEPDHNLLKIWAASEHADGINGAHTGSWYNPDQDGQGWVIEVVSHPSGEDQFVVYFYGYENGEQLWLIGSGPNIDGNTATVDVIRTSGADWGNAFNPGDVELDFVGSMSFEFSGCDSASVEFTPGDTSLSAFSTEMVRLTGIAGRDCQSGQLDRVGRPGIAGLMIPPALREAYNTNSDPDTWILAYADEVEDGLTALDSADLVMGNGYSDPATLAPIFADDRLQVDIAKGQTGSYFSIETSALVPQDWNIAAGRSLSTDVLDETLAMLVSAWDPWVGDFVDANDVPFLQEFPFLAAPH